MTICSSSEGRVNREIMIINIKTMSSAFVSDRKIKTDKFSCKLTTPELQKRKESVIASLKTQILSRKELQNGYAFRFAGTDTVLDELTEFIKTERTCCDFFTFKLSVKGDKSEAWLELVGAEGVKDFITMELGL